MTMTSPDEVETPVAIIVIENDEERTQFTGAMIADHLIDPDEAVI